MPYLNWKEVRIDRKIVPSADETAATVHRSRARMTIGAPLESLAQLARELSELMGKEGAELRVDLPGNWVLFFKRRDGESRCLVAHPQPEEWVATLALEEPFGRSLSDRLAILKAGESVELASLGTLGAVSNLELTLAALLR